MAFGVTDAGFKAKKFDDIKTEVAANLKTELGIDITSLPDSVAEVITNIYILPLSQAWANTQSLQNMFDIDKATGVWLDNLVALRGVQRSNGTYPFGDIYVTASAPVNILAGSVWSDSDGNTFTNESNINISEDLATTVVYNLADNILPSAQFVVTIDGINYLSSDTLNIPNSEKLESLKSAIETDRPDLLVTPFTESIIIASVEDTLQFSISTGQYLELGTIIGYGQITSDVLSTQSYSENTVINAPTYTAIQSINNPRPIQGGSGREDDETLRLRYKATERSGKGTVEAIRSALLSLSGVINAIVLENDSSEYDAENDISPNSFKCVVKGGGSQAIVDTIWLTKPAGIRSDGDSKGIITDSQGIQHSISYSRVKDKYIHVNIFYTKYDEEEFPEDGETSIANTVLSFGEGLNVGEDVIQQRIMSNIFQNITGLQEVDVLIGATDSPTDSTPLLVASPPIDISILEEASFSLDRISVFER
ncbi:hypothetical protein [Pseudoalteromonas phage J2-1]|uniref:Baseplate protein J-like domain-containing protein n=1 Tax=Pseudoalteromonas phage J2-1 TaxID=2023998 RepID=A0A223LH96_9CAUD|nr:baseplate wedge subunit [Pseudoalteromonas phage J2-1]ASU03362.1 hypothetical protein [Pseudoalteromonas phage J2-1]